MNHVPISNRVIAPAAQELEGIDTNMNAEEILDLIENDPNRELCIDQETDLISELTHTDKSGPEGSEHLDSEDVEYLEADIVSKWEENGSTNIASNALSGVDSSYLVDGAIVPIKHEIDDRGVLRMPFVEGKKILWGAKELQFHDPATLSLAFLDRSEDGVLHAIPGWSQREVIEDIAYRFKAGRVMVTEIPFLGGVQCKKRTYECQGVLVCAKSTPEFHTREHCRVEDNDEDLMKTVKLFEDTEIMKRNALNIFREISGKRKYCSACVWNSNGVPKNCEGGPTIRARKGDVLYGSKYFLGCSGFSRAPNVNHAFRKLDSLDEEGISYLRKLLSGEIRPPDIDPDRECTYVHGKKRRCASFCQIHKEPLVHVPCLHHRMNVFEPMPQPGVDVPKMLYVSCFGRHTHPPPPPPDHTFRKMQMLEAEAELDPKSSAVVLRKRVGEKLQKQLNEGVSGKMIRGSAHLPAGRGGRVVRRLRESKRKVVPEAEGLMALAVDSKFPYCRDIKIVGPDIVVTCAHDAMLMHAALCTKFAGDATYKTVTERTRKQSSGRWYLYNIIAPTRADGGNSKGVIVFRALMTGLSADVYRVVWRCFLREIISCADIIRGEEVPGSGVLRVPYQELPPALIQRSCYVTSVTTDLEAAEVKGCAQALADLCGGSASSHIAGLIIGCGVHLDRDLRQRLRCSKIKAQTAVSETDRWAMYRSFVCAQSESEALEKLQVIELFDPAWVRWVNHSGLLPVVCKAFSRMTSANRANGFLDTNVVESHNRRGNDMADVHMHPFDAIHELGKLDELDIAKLNNGIHKELRGPRPPRQRSDYTLAPSGSRSRCGKKRRNSSGSGMGPARKRASVSESAGNNVSDTHTGAEGAQKGSSGRTRAAEKGSVSFIILMRVQRMLCQLEIKTLGDTSISEETRDTRSEALT